MKKLILFLLVCTFFSCTKESLTSEIETVEEKHEFIKLSEQLVGELPYTEIIETRDSLYNVTESMELVMKDFGDTDGYYVKFVSEQGEIIELNSVVYQINDNDYLGVMSFRNSDGVEGLGTISMEKIYNGNYKITGIEISEEKHNSRYLNCVANILDTNNHVGMIITVGGILGSFGCIVCGAVSGIIFGFGAIGCI